MAGRSMGVPNPLRLGHWWWWHNASHSMWAGSAGQRHSVNAGGGGEAGNRQTETSKMERGRGKIKGVTEGRRIVKNKEGWGKRSKE